MIHQETLDKLITAMGESLGDKYTVCHLFAEDRRNGPHPYYRIGVIDNDRRIAASVAVPCNLVAATKYEKYEPGLKARVVSILSHEALRSISILEKDQS